MIVQARPRDGHQEPGFTLIEVLVAMVVTVIVMAVLANIVGVSTRAERETKASATSSTSAYSLAAYFADDVASAGGVPGSTGIDRAATGCGSAPAVVRIAGPGKTQPVTLRSYVVISSAGAAKLERRECSGATVAAALASTPRSVPVVTDLDPAPGSVTVTCDSDGQTPPGGDEGCQHATMTVRTVSGRVTTVEGTVASAATPSPTTTPQTPNAPATGTCTILASSSTWGATGGQAGSSGSNHAGDQLMYTYDDTNQRRSFFQFDLTDPCADAAPTWPTLPGGRAISSATLQLAYMGHNTGNCGILGISYNSQRLHALGAGSTWEESTLTGSNMPSGLRPASYTFDRANDGSLTTHTNALITDAVTNWYTGTWPNRGFRLSRSGAGDTCGRSSQWASSNNSNLVLRPRLVITWAQP